ncbi:MULTISPECIES: MerR family transcriptional regulator [unclassified Aureimonas]|uniref:MerR family transcriptional regulator n=1 Tax=unclassified Aureimonas TaxID=2615206 RepID=UPI0006FCA854|nr:MULTISPECIES: MerR family DNA-binding transcriptional regulator [unclassified Aureimonas]KQT55127.1 transcriptional regulator [Aureimonas sp. Leaf427]KQT70916.1 transcriptional regulator [Aureimonas sp. Leaf460]
MNQQIAPDEALESEVSFDIDFLLGTSGDPEPSRESFRIGDLSREFGVTLRTLRFYEDRGLLNPERRGTTRLYSRRDRARLRLVLLAKTLGFSLTEAKQIIEIYDQPNGPRRQMEVALERFQEQHEVLLEQRREIDGSIRAMEASIALVRSKLGMDAA